MSALAFKETWMAEGRAEGMAEGLAIGMLEARRSDVLKVMRLRFPEAPYDVIATIRGINDLDQLTRWLESAIVATTLDMFLSMATSADQRAKRNY